MFGFGDGKSKDEELDEFLGEADKGEVFFRSSGAWSTSELESLSFNTLTPYPAPYLILS